MTGAPTHDLLVVGFGPVGATLAGLAERHGCSVLVVDREREMFPLPRAAHCDHEVLRILQELGCAEEALAGVVVNDGMDFLDSDHEVLFGLRSPGVEDSGWPASVLFHQPTFEGLLRRQVEASGVDVRLGVGVTDLRDEGDRVVARLDDGTEVRARFAVGCDGARSTVRRILGTTMDDLGFEEPWLVMDLFLGDGVQGLPAHVWQVCDPARPTTLVPMPAPRFRFEFMLLPGEDPDDVQRPEHVSALLSPWVDPDRVRVERAAVYTFHGLIADQWRRGRILLAGDAAHQTPPFLGQGMCAGMRDAANLAWKLAAVVRDRAPESLLDTYRSEREPHVRAVIEMAVSFGRIICTTDPEVAAERDAGFRAAADQRERTPRLPGLGAGPGVVEGGGSLAPQPRLDGVLLDDLVGPRFCLVTAAPLAEDDPARRWWGDRALVLDAATHPALAPVLGGAEARPDGAVLIRPDRYVLGTGTAEHLTGVAADWLGTPAHR